MYSHRDLCELTGMFFLRQHWCQLMTWETRFSAGMVDVLAVSTRQKRPRVATVEVKRTRSDLISDLRRKKMLKYEKQASHCYLAATAEALKLDSWTKTKVLRDLAVKGLPGYWGILVLPTQAGDRSPYFLRNPRQIKPAHPRTIQAAIKRIAISMMWRTLKTIDY